MSQPSGRTGENALLTAYRACRRVFLLVSVFSLFINLSMLVVPMYMLQVYDRVLASRSTTTLVMLTLVAVLVVLTLSVLEVVRSRILVRTSLWLDGQVSPTLIGAIFSTGHDIQPARDLDRVRQFLTGSGLLAFFDAPWTPLYLGAIFLLHPLLGLIATGGAVVLAILAVANEVLTHGPLSRSASEASTAERFAQQASRNAEVIRAMGLSPGLITRWQGSHSKAIGLQAVGSDRAAVLSAAARFIRLGLQVAILGFGAWLSILEIVSPGVMIAASILMGRALAPIEVAIGQWSSFVLARGANIRLKAFVADFGETPERMSLPPVKGNVTLEHVFVAAPDSERFILKDISLELQPGQTLGITGPSAAGKSTLARIIVGVWRQQRGAVRVDGFDLGAWDPVELGRQIGYLPQDVELFDGAIHENISRFEEPDPDAVVAAARLAGVYDLVSTFADGFNTRIGAGGGILSGGQRQRIALARAVYRNPPIVVLDEPSSNLDTEGDYGLREAIRRLKEAGKTVIIIAHRPSILNDLDLLMVLQDGTVAAMGPTKEIMPQITRRVVMDPPGGTGATALQPSSGGG